MKEIYDILKLYVGQGFVWVVYLVALFYLLLTEKDKIKRALFVYIPAAILIVFILPPVYKFYTQYEQSNTYYRMLWLIPSSISIIYAFLNIFKDKVLLGVFITSALIILTGHYSYYGSTVLDASNVYKIPQSAINICDFVEEQSDNDGAKIAVPASLVAYIRQYDTQITMPYGREVIMPERYNTDNEIYKQLESDKVNSKKLASAAKEQGCEFIVAYDYVSFTSSMESYGYKLLRHVNGYNIYELIDSTTVVSNLN